MCLALILLLACSQAAPTEIVVPNGSFEVARDNELLGWRLIGPWQPAPGGGHGKQCVRLLSDESKQWQKLLQTGYVEVSPGERLTLSVWYRSATGNVDAGLELCGDAGRHIKWGAVQVQGKTEDWALLRREFTIDKALAQAGVRSTRIYLQVTRTGADVAFDSVTLLSSRPPQAADLLKGSTPEPRVANPLANPGFEAGAGGLPTGWAKLAAEKEGENLATWDNTGRTGRSLRLTPAARSDGAAPEPVGWRSGLMQISPRSAYKLSIWVKTERMHDASTRVTLSFRDLSGRAVIHVIQSGTYGGQVDWHQIKLEWKPEDLVGQYASVDLTATIEGNPPGSAWLDDLRLEPVLLDIAGQCGKPNALLEVSQPKKFHFDLRSFGPKAPPQTLRCGVKDYWQNEIWQRQYDLVWAEGRASADVELPLTRPGYYELTASCDGLGAAATVTFGIVEPFDPSIHVDESPLGSHWTTSAPGSMATAREGSVKWIRRSIGWTWIERQPGQWHWGHVDKLVEELASEGLRLYPVLSATPKWASVYQDGMPKGAYRATYRAYPPKDMALFEGFAWQVARRYRDKLPYYEIWNEPNGRFFMGTNEEFAQLVRAGYKGLKLADPECKVMFDTAGTSFNFYEDMWAKSPSHSPTSMPAASHTGSHRRCLSCSSPGEPRTAPIHSTMR